MTDILDSAVDTLRTFAENPKDEKCASNALATLSKLAKTSFGKKLNDLGFVENDDAFDLNAIFALNVLNELSTFNHKPLCDLSQSCSNIDGYVFIEIKEPDYGFERYAIDHIPIGMIINGHLERETKRKFEGLAMYFVEGKGPF